MTLAIEETGSSTDFYPLKLGLESKERPDSHYCQPSTVKN